MDKLASGVIIIAACVGIVAGGMYIASSTRVDCVDWWPFSKGKTCALTVR